jgi:Bacterial CdiA-CT RNAse A domain
MEGSDGLEVVVSPLQLAAILENDSVEESSSLSNRFWGAATLVGGAIELVGAAGLLLTPEPTMVTKVAGGALAVHGADTASTGIVQIISGRTRTTLTSQAAAAAAEALGASPDSAKTVGMVVDIAVPLAAGFVGAARAIAIRRGAINLASEEAAGGHTIARHVGRTEEQLRARLFQESKIPAATTFRTLREAERVLAEALRANKEAIKTWAKTATAGQTKAFTHEAGRVIGQGVVRSTNQMHEMTKVVVVLKKVVDQNRIYFVLTSYPKPF